jgi:hypothetical protein
MCAVTQIIRFADVTGDVLHPALVKKKNVVEMKTLLLNLTQATGLDLTTVLLTTQEKKFAVQDQMIVLLCTMVKSIVVETMKYQLQLA